MIIVSSELLHPSPPPPPKAVAKEAKVVDAPVDVLDEDEERELAELMGQD